MSQEIKEIPAGFDIVGKLGRFLIAEIIGVSPQMEADGILDRQLLPRGPFATWDDARQDLATLLADRENNGGLAER